MTRCAARQIGGAAFFRVSRQLQRWRKTFDDGLALAGDATAKDFGCALAQGHVAMVAKKLNLRRRQFRWLNYTRLQRAEQRADALGSRDWNVSSDWYRWTFKP